MVAPLEGIRVIEIGTLIAAPFAARLLAEFGAEVVKIEPTVQGDPLRRWRKLHHGTSLWWYLQSRNKMSMALNLKSADGVDIVRRLLAEADLLIENMRPGALEALGLGWEAVHALNPRLTMVRISGYGQTGPYRDRPGFGAIGEAMGGIRHTTGDPDRPPARTGISLGDSLASLYAVIGALIALLRVRTGQGDGQMVDVSLCESVLGLMESLIPECDLLGFVRTRTGGALPGISPSNTYPTRDGDFIVIAGNSDPIFRRLMAVIGRPDLAADPALRHNDGRVRDNERLDRAIAAWTAEHRIADALHRLAEAEVPASRIYSAADILSDPHYQARDMIVAATLPGGAVVRMPGIVPKLSDTPGEIRWLGPDLGRHTDTVLRRLCFDEGEIARLRSAGVVA